MRNELLKTKREYNSAQIRWIWSDLWGKVCCSWFVSLGSKKVANAKQQLELFGHAVTAKACCGRAWGTGGVGATGNTTQERVT